MAQIVMNYLNADGQYEELWIPGSGWGEQQKGSYIGTGNGALYNLSIGQDENLIYSFSLLGNIQTPIIIDGITYTLNTLNVKLLASYAQKFELTSNNSKNYSEGMVGTFYLRLSTNDGINSKYKNFTGTAMGDYKVYFTYNGELLYNKTIEIHLFGYDYIGNISTDYFTNLKDQPYFYNYVQLKGGFDIENKIE